MASNIRFQPVHLVILPPFAAQYKLSGLKCWSLKCWQQGRSNEFKNPVLKVAPCGSIGAFPTEWSSLSSFLCAQSANYAGSSNRWCVSETMEIRGYHLRIRCMASLYTLFRAEFFLRRDYDSGIHRAHSADSPPNLLPGLKPFLDLSLVFAYYNLNLSFDMGS